MAVLRVGGGRVVGEPAMSTTIAGPGHISLVQHETVGGHTIAKHLGKSDAFLFARLQNEPSIPSASTFLDLPTAEKAVNDAIQANLTGLTAWLGSTRVSSFLDHDANVIVGRGA